MSMAGKKRILTEEEIDKIVVAQADDESAWTKPIHVRRPRSASVSLSAELITRATFFARLHHETNVELWLKRIIEERIDLEEAAFAGLKRDLSEKRREVVPET